MTPAILLLDLAGILAVCGLLAHVAKKLGQPAVIGELLGGILVGPMVLGPLSATLFPDSVRPTLTGLGNLGVALFMFGLGLELSKGHSGKRNRDASVIALGATALPFVLGCGCALLLVTTGYQRPEHALGFVLFLGIALAITAFPVLARILVDHALEDTELGRLAMSVAAVCDVLAWSALAAVIAVTSGADQGWWKVALVIPLVLLLLAIRPLLRGLRTRFRPSRPVLLIGLVAGALACGAVTELAGLHFIFGTFVFGALLPRVGDVEDIRTQVTNSGRLLLPVYFASVGFQLQLSLEPGSIGVLALVLVLAFAGKMLGTYAPARLCGIEPKTAAPLASLMNTRGLTELVVLTTGFSMGILDRDLFSIMVVMALVTTAATGPLLRWNTKRATRALVAT